MLTRLVFLGHALLDLGGMSTNGGLIQRAAGKHLVNPLQKKGFFTDGLTRDLRPADLLETVHFFLQIFRNGKSHVRHNKIPFPHQVEYVYTHNASILFK